MNSYAFRTLPKWHLMDHSSSGTVEHRVLFYVYMIRNCGMHDKIGGEVPFATSVYSKLTDDILIAVFCIKYLLHK